MTRHRDIERLLEDWMSDLPSHLPDRVVDALVDQVGRTPQWRPFGLPWRDEMNRMIFGLASAAVVVVVVVLGVSLYFNSPGVAAPPSPSPSPTAEPSPDPTSAPTAAPAATFEPTAKPRPTANPSPVAGLPVGPFDVEGQEIAMTVIIPASGWTFGREVTALAKGDDVDLPEAAILFWAYPAGTGFYVPGDPCQVTSTKPDTPATTVEDLAAALAAQASRDASELVDVMVGGYAGKSIILHVPDDAVSDECEMGQFVSYGTEEDALGRYHQGPGQIDELWILDVDGTIMILDAMYRPDTPAELIDEMRAIIESTTFDIP